LYGNADRALLLYVTFDTMNLRQKIILAYFRIKIRAIQLFSSSAAAKEAYRIFCSPFQADPGNLARVFAGAQKSDFLWNGLNISGYCVNPAGNKKLLLLHGFNSNCNKFSHYVAPAVEKGYCVFAFDAPAHGYSDGKRINGMDYARFIISLSGKFGSFQSFISHSFGGLAVCLALEQMNIPANTKLVLIAPATETTSAVNDAFKKLGINSTRVRDQFNRLILSIAGHPVSWFSVRRAIKNFKADVLWIHDYDDQVTPIKDALAVKDDGHPNIRFIFTHRLGHNKIYRTPEQIAEVMAFL